MTAFLWNRRRRRGGRLVGSLAGVAAGAGLMYLLDPRRGTARRSDVAQRAGRIWREVEGTVGAGARDLRHRASGVAHEARARISGERPGDEVIVERVRAKLGRLTAHPGAVRVISHDGHVELSGPVFEAEHAQVLRGIRLVRGVRSVEDRLEPHTNAEGVPALQGAGPRAGPRPEPLQDSWSPGMKLLAGGAGALLVGRALFGTGVARIPAGIAGAALLGKLFGESEPARREVRRVAREVSGLANRERERSREGEGHRGAWHPEPEVRRVDPSEIERGVASGRPEPTFPSRVDRGGARGGGGWKAAGEDEGAAGQGTSEVAGGPGAGWVAPSPGGGVHERDLGSVRPTEPEEAPREGEGEEGGPKRGEPA